MHGGESSCDWGDGGLCVGDDTVIEASGAAEPPNGTNPLFVVSGLGDIGVDVELRKDMTVLPGENIAEIHDGWMTLVMPWLPKNWVSTSVVKVVCV